MFCPKCGNNLPDTAKFCDKCGHKTENHLKETVVKTTKFQNKNFSLYGIWIMAALILTILFVKKPMLIKKTDWIGYDAELQKGKYVKSATYIVNGEASTIEYDFNGRITKVDCSSLSEHQAHFMEKSNLGDHKEYFIEKIGNRLPLKPCGYAILEDGAFEPLFIDSSGENYYEYLADGRIKINDSSKNQEDEDGYVIFECDDWNRVLSYNNSKRNYEFQYTQQGLLSKFYDGYRHGKIDYSKDGKIKEICYYYAGYNEPYRIRYVYNELGLLILKQKVEYRDFEEYIYWEYKYEEYDENGNLISFKFFEDKDYEKYLKNEFKYEYDKSGNMIKSEVYEYYGDKPYITLEYEYQYNKQGLMKKSVATSYHYEANSDYSKVNLLNKKTTNKTFDAYWEISYYSKTELEQYKHDIEFNPIN